MAHTAFSKSGRTQSFLRAVQIARGELVGYRLPQGALPNARKLLLCWGDRGVDAATREKTNTSEVEGRLEDRLQGLDAKLPLPALRQPPSDIAGPVNRAYATLAATRTLRLSRLAIPLIILKWETPNSEFTNQISKQDMPKDLATAKKSASEIQLYIRRFYTSPA